AGLDVEAVLPQRLDQQGRRPTLLEPDLGELPDRPVHGLELPRPPFHLRDRHPLGPAEGSGVLVGAQGCAAAPGEEDGGDGTQWLRHDVPPGGSASRERRAARGPRARGDGMIPRAPGRDQGLGRGTPITTRPRLLAPWPSWLPTAPRPGRGAHGGSGVATGGAPPPGWRVGPAG